MAKSSREPSENVLEIYVGWENEGGVYKLAPWSKQRIYEAFPEAVVMPTTLLGYDKTRDYDRFHRPYYEQMARMLTGLGPEQIGILGGVRIFDPGAKKVLWEWRPGPKDGK